MKAFEGSPGKYDLGMRLVTFGTVDRLHEQIVASVKTGDKVLDVGCGTGALLSLLARKDVEVTAIDRSQEMIDAARERVARDSAGAPIALSRNTVMEADMLFRDGQFDCVILSLVLSEMTEDEQAWALGQCARLLKSSGLLIIADEFRPRTFASRIAFFAARMPAHLAAYLYIQIKDIVTTSFWWKLYYTVVELPLMLISFLVSDPLVRPLKNVEESLPDGLRLVDSADYWGGCVRLLRVRKEC